MLHVVYSNVVLSCSEILQCIRELSVLTQIYAYIKGPLPLGSVTMIFWIDTLFLHATRLFRMLFSSAFVLNPLRHKNNLNADMDLYVIRSTLNVTLNLKIVTWSLH